MRQQSVNPPPPQSCHVEIKCHDAYQTLDQQFLRGTVTLTLTEREFPDLSQLYISLEGKETFIFKSGEPKPRMASTIQNQSKFYQSEQVLLFMSGDD